MGGLNGGAVASGEFLEFAAMLDEDGLSESCGRATVEPG